MYVTCICVCRGLNKDVHIDTSRHFGFQVFVVQRRENQAHQQSFCSRRDVEFIWGVYMSLIYDQRTMNSLT